MDVRRTTVPMAKEANAESPKRDLELMEVVPLSTTRMIWVGLTVREL